MWRSTSVSRPSPGVCLTDEDEARLEKAEIPEEHAAATTYGVLLRRHQCRSPVLLAFLSTLDPKFG